MFLAGAGGNRCHVDKVLLLVSAFVDCTRHVLTGKSFLLNRIIEFFRQDYGADFNASVAVTAATGIAATHISGTTLHSQTGCGVPQTVEDFDRMWKPQSRDRWRKMKVGHWTV